MSASCIRIWMTACPLPLIARLRAEPDLCVGDNEPYAGHLPGDAIDRHALQPGRHNTLDRGAAGSDRPAAKTSQHWATRLAPLLEAALVDVDAVQDHLCPTRRPDHG